jgi:hypothetical protein
VASTAHLPLAPFALAGLFVLVLRRGVTGESALAAYVP